MKIQLISNNSKKITTNQEYKKNTLAEPNSFEMYDIKRENISGSMYVPCHVGQIGYSPMARSKKRHHRHATP